MNQNKTITNTFNPNPLAYRERIKTESAASKYLLRSGSKQRAENNLVTRGLKYLPKGATVLDAPCGNGRMSLLLARQGYHVTGCDMSDHTLENARKVFERDEVQGDFLKRDIEALDFTDKKFESTLCFRFYHHLPTADVRRLVVGELCRVTRKSILISYLDIRSPTMIKRRLRHSLGGRCSVQHGSHLSELEALFAPYGYELREDLAQLRFFKSLHLACFVSR